MKYFTKEYKKCANSSPFIKLKISRRADRFSEEYFNELYAAFEWDYGNREVSDSEIPCLYEDSFFRLNEEHYKTYYPKRIIDKIADTRVLAMGYVSPRNFIKVYLFRKKIEKKLYRTICEYNREYTHYRDELPEELKDEFFYDTVILSLKEQREDLILEMTSPIFRLTEYGHGKIIFNNYKILEQECNIFPIEMTDGEIYKTDDGFELHLLLADDKEYYYLTIFGESMKVEYCDD